MALVMFILVNISAFFLTSCAALTAKLVRLHPCPYPKPPFAEHPIVEEHYALVTRNNVGVISGNITFLGACDDCRWTIEFGKLTNGRKKSLVHFKGLDCNSLMIKYVLQSRGIQMDSKNCKAKLGTYVATDLDMNDIYKDSRMPLPFRATGVYEFETQYSSPKETHSCLVTQVVVEKSKKKKTSKVKDYSVIPS